jgi:integrase/recombinase XerD
MTTLRQKMIEDMQLHSFAERTQDSYLRAVRQLAAYFNKPPDQITEEELRQYFLYLKNVKKASRSTITLALCGIKFFYERTLQRQWATLAIVRPQQEKKLPVVLSVEEVRQILSRVRRWRYRVCLSTIYACGLRLQEGLHLQIGHIDGGRQLLRVCHGKGGKDRYVPLPQPVLEMLRQYWATHRHPVWIFPSSHHAVKRPMDPSGVQRAFQGALLDSGIQKHATVHTCVTPTPHICWRAAEPALDTVLPGACLAQHDRYLHTPDQTERRSGAASGQSRRGGVVGLELADIFRLYGPAYRQKYADQILPSHWQAMRAIQQCRTEALGGQVYTCPECGEVQYSYHSCRNRHCPKCQNDKAQEWLGAQQDMLLPVPYFMLTFTLPAALNEIVRSNQSLLYNLLFRVSRGCHAAPGERPAFRGRPNRPSGCPAHLGTQPVLSPAYPLPGSGRWPGSRCTNLAACPTGFLAAREGAFENLPRQVPPGLAKRRPSSLRFPPRSGSRIGWCTAKRWAMGAPP